MEALNKTIYTIPTKRSDSEEDDFGEEVFKF